jgi:hypothetical protein
MRTLRFVRSNRTPALKLAARAAIGAYTAFAGLNAQAADLTTVSPAFGNTVVSTYPDGRTLKIMLHPDGSWDGVARSGVPLAGRWQIKGEKLCMRQSKPPTLPISFCTPFPEHSEPGVQWTSRDVLGTPIRLSLQKGMPAQAPQPQTTQTAQTAAPNQAH